MICEQGPGMGPHDDGYDEDGYDESQRAEILEVMRGGPGDGAIQTDLEPDMGEDIDADDDDLDVIDDLDEPDVDESDA